MGGVAGKIMPRPMGKYDPSTTYRILDMVTLGNKLWIAKRSNLIGIEPNASNSNYWMLGLDGMTVDEISAEFEGRITAVETGKSDVPTVIDFNIPITGWTEEASMDLIAIGGVYRQTFITTVPYNGVTNVSATIQLAGISEAQKCKMLDLIECDKDDTGLMLAISFFTKTIPTAQIPVKIYVQH